MSVKKKNLLEAFQSAGETNFPKVEPIAPAPTPEVSVEPVPAAATSSTAGKATSMTEPMPRVGTGAPHLGVVIFVGVAFALGILVGRSTGGDVAAADPSEAGGATDESAGLDREGDAGRFSDPRFDGSNAGIVPARSPDASGAEESAAEPRSVDVSAILDPANEFTVVVATYGATMEDHAWAAFDFLRDQGIPVFRPYPVRDKLVILAGATARRADLAPLERRVRNLTYDGQQGAFDDAYSIRINDYVQR